MRMHGCVRILPFNTYKYAYKHEEHGKKKKCGRKILFPALLLLLLPLFASFSGVNTKSCQRWAKELQLLLRPTDRRFNVLKFKRLLVVVRRCKHPIYARSHTCKTYWRQCSWLCWLCWLGRFYLHFFPTSSGVHTPFILIFYINMLLATFFEYVFHIFITCYCYR